MAYKTLAPGVVIVGHFDPPSFLLTHSDIDKGVRSKIKEFLDERSSGGIRDPQENLRLRTDAVASMWHKDISFMYADNLAMILWSNREQTEIKLPDETIIQPDPCDIVMVHNEKAMHRTPQLMSNDRWFYRNHVRAPEWL